MLLAIELQLASELFDVFEHDGASRVLLPPELRAWAGLEREVVFMGMGNRFELWDRARYDAHEAEVLGQDMNAQLSGLFIG